MKIEEEIMKYRREGTSDDLRREISFEPCIPTTKSAVIKWCDAFGDLTIERGGVARILPECLGNQRTFGVESWRRSLDLIEASRLSKIDAWPRDMESLAKEKRNGLVAWKSHRLLKLTRILSI